MSIDVAMANMTRSRADRFCREMELWCRHENLLCDDDDAL